jgi:ribonuclease E
MSNNKMLIDATHPEETRVVVLRGGRVEEFDFESAARKLLRGNIYLAKVTRVEPSLQAAFVEYGGNRHGFLAFNEIHPDYYQIPMADRQALIEEEAAAEAAEEAAVDAHAEALARRRQRNRSNADGEEAAHAHDSEDGGDLEPDGEEPAPTEAGAHTIAEASLPEDDRIVEPSSAANEDEGVAANENTLETHSSEEMGVDSSTPAAEATGEGSVHEVESNGASTDVERVEQVGSGEDALEELPSRPRRRPRSYKIQEVIKRRQVILVQVVKEERGNKGAALTTYLSLAGRYTVLMPNTARGGGISRKITNPQDRKRLKAIAAELEVPEGMGLIIRTAGAARTKQEIKRDFEYLLRLWESVRDLTLQSQAPSLVYEEGNLIKRSIRDLYNKDVEEVIVAGPDAYKEAKDFMRMLMPSHAKNVIAYQEPEPLFTRHKIESQLNAMFSPYVTLRSGGYLVINQTEALVAVDVNSGKSTREFSIEETALNTNLEAADEIARQLKLRDLAGLIVVDFIDMEEKRNNRAVERRLKEALRHDRARIQVGRISHFGLLEMSRQRLRTGVLEGSTSQCPHCQGTGIIRSTESVALAVLRGLEDAIMAGARAPLIATTTPSVALYILNNKRPFINDMEARHGLPITVTGSDKLAGANFTIEKGTAPVLPQRRAERIAVNMEWGFEGEADEETDGKEAAALPREVAPAAERAGDEQGQRRRRRRRRRGGSGGGRRDERYDREGAGESLHAADEHFESHGDESGAMDDGQPADGVDDVAEAAPADGEERRGGRNRRRGRRGGRRGRERQARGAEASTGGAGSEPGGNEPPEGAAYASRAEPTYEAAGAPETLAGDERSQRSARGRGRTRENESEPAVVAPEPRSEPVARAAKAEPEAAPPKRSRPAAGASEPRIERIVVGEASEVGAEAPRDEGAAPTRKGWWQRRLSGE